MQLGAEPLLTRAEEIGLAGEIEAGVLAREALGTPGRVVATETELTALAASGESARQRFIRANLRLVAMVTRPAAVRTRLPEAELFQEGCLGLIVAVQRFDHRRGYKFSTYALCWIRAYVGAATSTELGATNLPASRADQLRTVRGVETELAQVLGRPPAVAELAAALGRSESWTSGVVSYLAPQPLDLIDTDALVHPGGLDAVFEGPGRELLANVEGVERQVLELRLGFADGAEHSYADTARALGMSVARVRRAEQRALERLRSVCPMDARPHL
jgi:RNA polymerase sigma factor (sigma-70 family)